MASLIRRIAEGTFIISLSNILITFFGFLTSILLIRVLGIYEFGLLSLALSAFNIIVIFLDFGIGNVLIADVARELGNGRADRTKSLLLRYAQMELLLGSVLFLLVFFSANFFAAKYNETIGTLIRISAFLLILAAVGNIFMVAFNSHIKFGYFSFMQSIESASRLLFIFILVVIAGKGVVGAMLAYLFSSATSVVFSFPLFMKTAEYLVKVERARENLFINTIKGHGKYVISYQPLLTLNQNLPFWIIKYLLGVKAVGIFSVAWKMTNFFLGLLQSLEQVLVPIVSEMSVKGKEWLSVILHKTIKYSLIFSLITLILAQFFVSPLINILFVSKYVDSIPIFRILIVVSLVNAFNIPLRPLFFSLKAQKYLFITYLINFTVILSMGSFSAYFLGISGMAFVIVFGLAIMIFMRYYYLNKVFHIEVHIDLLRFDEYDRILGSKIKEKIRAIITHFKQKYFGAKS